MCQAISGIAVKSGRTVVVYTSAKTDSHTEIREEHNIRDDDGPVAQYQTPIELIPVTDLFDINGMEFRFDAWRPDWWTGSMTRAATKQLHRSWMARWDGMTLKMESDVYLGSLKEIPAGVTIEAGGYVDLRNLKEMPAGVTIEAGGYVYLRNLKEIHAGVTIKAGGYVDLGNLKEMPAGVTIEAGGYVYLDDGQGWRKLDEAKGKI